MAEANASHELVLDDPRPVTAGYAFTFVAALLLLGCISLIWAAFLIIALVLLLIEGAGLPLLAVGMTGMLLFRAWTAMAQTMRRRLNPVDVTDYEALPPHFGMLSRPLQRIVAFTRTTRAAIAQPDITPPELSRALFEWLMSIKALEGDDVRDLADRGFTVEALELEIQSLGHSETARSVADTLLSRFESSLLHRDADPFR